MNINYDVNVSLIEIYNNKCYDILNNKNQIQQREDYDRKFILSNIKKRILKKKDIIDLNQIILESRRTGVSSENDASSRSHLQLV